MTHDDLVAVLLLLGVCAVDVVAEGGLDASPVFVILLEDGTQGEIRPRPRVRDHGSQWRPPMQRMREEFSFQKASPPPPLRLGRGGGDAVLEIGPATHPCGSAPTHWLVTAAGSFHMQRPEQRQRDGVEVFSHHGVRLPVGDGGHRLDGGAFPQQVAAQELHSWSHGQQHGNHIPLNPGACWVTGGGG